MVGLRGVAAAMLICGAGAQAALAEQAVVVELFTSQGCSSCPGADDYLAELTRAPGVIALALHVDYWDYIGWKDTFAHAAFTQRQYDYANAAGAKSVYTPQFLIGGRDPVVGNDPQAVAALIRDHAAQTAVVDLALRAEAGQVRISAAAPAGLTQGAVVQVIHYLPEQSVAIKRGENAGRTISYHNVVTRIDTLGHWDGASPFQASVKAEGPLVVVVQAEGAGPILGAAQLP